MLTNNRFTGTFRASTVTHEEKWKRAMNNKVFRSALLYFLSAESVEIQLYYVHKCNLLLFNSSNFSYVIVQDIWLISEKYY